MIDSRQLTSRLTALLAIVLMAGAAPGFTETNIERPPPFLREWQTGIGPVGIAIDDQDIVYVVFGSLSNIQVFTLEGQHLYGWGGSGVSPGKFDRPTDIALGPNGHLYVTDGHNNAIQEFTRSGEYVRGFWAGRPLWDPSYRNGVLDRPYGIEVDREGKVFVSDHFNSRIKVFSADLQFLYQWGSEGTDPGQFKQPLGIAIDADGTVYVADNQNHRVQKFTNSGNFLGQWTSGQGNAIPHGIAADGHGRVYVVVRNDRNYIECFGTSGERLTTWGSTGQAPGQFYDPMGIAMDRKGRIYIADSASRRIQVFGYEPVSVQPTTWSRIKTTIPGSSPQD